MNERNGMVGQKENWLFFLIKIVNHKNGVNQVSTDLYHDNQGVLPSS
jgi:hypothetical protein